MPIELSVKWFFVNAQDDSSHSTAEPLPTSRVLDTVSRPESTRTARLLSMNLERRMLTSPVKTPTAPSALPTNLDLVTVKEVSEPERTERLSARSLSRNVT